MVIPTVGRGSLAPLLEALDNGDGPVPRQIVVADDRPPDDDAPLTATEGFSTAPLAVVRTGGRGPAAARNAGWRAVGAEWIAFLDDDVEPPDCWRAELVADLSVPPHVVASQGRVRVPSPPRPPTDWERNTLALADARWITADMAYRREALVRLGGFDERFPRAYREDADLGMRASAIGSITHGRRWVTHPVRPAPWWASVSKQRGNADDALMASIHGRRWRDRAGAPAGRRRAHVATTAALATAMAAGVQAQRRRSRSRRPKSTVAVGLAATAGWLGSSARFAWTRIAPGPRTPPEVAAMAATSVLIPPAATFWWLTGSVRARRLAALPARAVLFDRDGTLVEDVPYNGEPDLVRLRPGARAAVDRLRRHGLAIGMVSNQSGVGSGRITRAQVEAVNHRVQALLGRFDVTVVCPHRPDDGCRCRKPGPLMVWWAAEQLGVRPEQCVVVGDIGSDVGAATAAGASSILVPNGVTRAEEVAAAPAVATDLTSAVKLILAGR